MLLPQLKSHLRLNRSASLFDMMIRFNLDADMLRQMLSFWIRKGCVRQCTKTPKCGVQCAKCDPRMIELYEWVD